MTDKSQDRLMEHNYDGIQEYDNPMPRWWIYIFWATAIFAALYWFNVPGVGTGKGRVANYQEEMKSFHARYGGGGPAVGPGGAVILAAAKDPAKLAAGKATFATTCAACHRPDGGGLIGPDLTDDYWIHGGAPDQVWATVNNGVLAKGMPAWGQTMKPEQVLDAVAYVISIRNTHPANPKPPQGVHELTGQPAPPSP
ncbi:MAG: c-type cytochrome [Candidatus Eisenbacteria bacterium]|nr:c-type cytochrome [Candidatus Eisenbacteria bacterium]